ncbi:hypothetical protein STEG23_033360, partial [Scotinomys teguina]
MLKRDTVDGLIGFKQQKGASGSRRCKFIDQPLVSPVGNSKHKIGRYRRSPVPDTCQGWGMYNEKIFFR